MFIERIQSGLQPTYEDLKRQLLKQPKGFLYRLQPTYEDLKLMVAVYLAVAHGVCSLPTRI